MKMSVSWPLLPLLCHYLSLNKSVTSLGQYVNLPLNPSLYFVDCNLSISKYMYCKLLSSLFYDVLLYVLMT